MPQSMRSKRASLLAFAANTLILKVLHLVGNIHIERNINHMWYMNVVTGLWLLKKWEGD
jgi:hypothetical protein